ncbi:MAG: carboxylate-amine ligase [Gaiellaceae bacterium]
MADGTSQSERLLFPRAAVRIVSVPGAEELLHCFREVSPLTIGIEEEILVVDAETLNPSPSAERLLAALAFEQGFAPEFRAAQIELATPVCTSVAQAASCLRDLRRELAACAPPDVAFLAAGAHPRAEPGPVSDRLRYRRIASECPWAGRWMLTCGLHVHVAVPGAKRALAVHDALRSFLPQIMAISVNSPYWRGEESGMASVRSRLNATLPRFGVPPAFGSLEAYAAFGEWGSASGTIPDASRHWWDLRLSPRYGTIEVRIADVQTRVEDAAAIAALVQSLIARLVRRYDDGDPLQVAATERIQENAWLAARDGMAGFLVDLENGERQPATGILGRLVGELMPFACELGCQRELADVFGLVAETGADLQRRLFARSGLEGLLRWLSEASIHRACDTIAANGGFERREAIPGRSYQLQRA